MVSPNEYPRIRSHWWPRSAVGRRAILAFCGLMALAQPPLVFWLANRVEPLIVGMPFLYAWLLVLYVAMIGVLLRAYWQRL